MVRVLISEALSLARGHCTVFFTIIMPLPTQVYKLIGSSEPDAGGNPMLE